MWRLLVYRQIPVLSAQDSYSSPCGERFDAHNFLVEAAGSGAGALLVSDSNKLPVGVPAIVVDDTLLALDWPQHGVRS